jgi:hypothetical protein
MNYSFEADSENPIPGQTHGRFAWIQEATRLCGEAGVDLSRFYALLVIVNGACDDQNGGLNTVMAISQDWGQPDWRWCNKCQCMTHKQDLGGPCAAGGRHDNGGSSNYRMSFNDSQTIGVLGFNRCIKCQCLTWTEDPSIGACAGFGTHDHRPLGEYRLGNGVTGIFSQQNWQRCHKCKSLAYHDRAETVGVCPAGNGHEFPDNDKYGMVALFSNFQQSFNAHETGHCFGLNHSWVAGVNGQPDIEYNDSWDIMSVWTSVRTFDNGAGWSPVGCGLNAGALCRMGWLGFDRVALVGASSLSSPQTFNLVALNRAEILGPLMILIWSSNHIYTIEFRRPQAWDTGIGQDAVLIHELRDTYLIDQRE